MVREAKPAIFDDRAREGPPVRHDLITQLCYPNRWSRSRSFVFREPVDPVALGIPQYHDIIPRKDARDLRTIRQRLDTDKYEMPEGWEADMDLMIRNAIHFNGEESEVGQIAVAFRERVKELRAQQGQKKRKESEKAGGDQPATKKAKLS